MDRTGRPRDRGAVNGATEPSTKLEIAIDNDWFKLKPQTVWVDPDETKLEDTLAEIVLGFFIYAEQFHHHGWHGGRSKTE